MRAALTLTLVLLPSIALAQDQGATDTETKTETTTPTPTPPAPAPAPVAAGEHARFRLDAKLGGGLLGLTGLVPQAVAGVAYGRFSVGLGLGFLRGSFGASSGTSGAEASVTVLTFMPTVAYDFYRTADDKLSFYGLLGLGPSIVVLNSGSTGMCSTAAGGVFGYQLAVGARYAVHPQLGVGFEVGPTGQLAWFGSSGTCGGGSNSLGAHGLYTALVGTFTTN